MFFLEAKNEFGGTISREQRGVYMDANEEAKKKMVKIAADVEQKEWRQFKTRYTCDKNKMRVLEVNLDENQND